MSDFNFDEWANLYKNYPEEYERKRKEVLEKEIMKAPLERRNNLRMLQMECDAYHFGMEPLAGLAEISKLMHGRLEMLKDEFIELAIVAGEIERDLIKVEKINNG
jgi:hypothetical protein